MNFSSILIVTYGRSGSTLLQGLLNSIDGCLIRGENYNFCYGLFNAYEAILDTKYQFDSECISREATSSWYGAALFDENKFLEDARKLVINQLNPTALKLNCIGFKEIRYINNAFSIKKLYDYLNFLERLFPNPAFLVLTREHNQVTNSGWWLNQDSIKVKAKLTEFEKIISLYGKNKNNVFYIDYSDIINQTKNLKKMYEFIGASYHKDTIEKVLSVPHSTKTIQDGSVATYTLHVEHTHQPIVEYAKIDDLPSHKNSQAMRIGVSGIVVIGTNYDSNGILIAVEGGREFQVNWKLLSPLIKTQFPKNPNAKNARFKIKHLKLNSDRATEIYFQDALSNRYLLFKISLKKDT